MHAVAVSAAVRTLVVTTAVKSGLVAGLGLGFSFAGQTAALMDKYPNDLAKWLSNQRLDDYVVAAGVWFAMRLRPSVS